MEWVNGQAFQVLIASDDHAITSIADVARVCRLQVRNCVWRQNDDDSGGLGGRVYGLRRARSTILEAQLAYAFGCCRFRPV